MPAQKEVTELVVLGLVGTTALIIGLTGLVRGKAPTGRGWAARSVQPAWFWTSIAFHLVLGGLMTALVAFLYLRP